MRVGWVKIDWNLWIEIFLDSKNFNNFFLNSDYFKIFKEHKNLVMTFAHIRSSIHCDRTAIKTAVINDKQHENSSRIPFHWHFHHTLVNFICSITNNFRPSHVSKHIHSLIHTHTHSIFYCKWKNYFNKNSWWNCSRFKNIKGKVKLW